MLHRAFVSSLLVTTAFASPVIQGAQTERSDVQSMLACWDQTFAYNGFRIERSDRRFYVTLRGSQLVKEGDFRVTNPTEQIHLDDSWNSLNHDYHISFLREDCTLDANALTLICAKGDLMINSYDQSFYRTQRIDSLGTIVDLTSLFPVQRLEVSASPTGLTLKNIHRYPGTGEVVTEIISILPNRIGEEGMTLGCDGTGDHWIPHAADALVNHLESR